MAYLEFLSNILTNIGLCCECLAVRTSVKPPNFATCSTYLTSQPFSFFYIYLLSFLLFTYHLFLVVSQKNRNIKCGSTFSYSSCLYNFRTVFKLQHTLTVTHIKSVIYCRKIGKNYELKTPPHHTKLCINQMKVIN